MFNFIQYLKKIKLPLLNSFDVAIDIGTSITKIAIKDKGVVLRQASCLCYNDRLKDYSFFGNEAKNIAGKLPKFLKMVKPIANGIITDFDAELALIKKLNNDSVLHYLEKYPLIKPGLRAIASVPIVATEIERKAVQELFYKAGFSNVSLIEKPLAIASTIKSNIFSYVPCMVVDMGGGLVELSIITGGGVVVEKTLKNAGNKMNRLILNYIYLKNGLILGENTAENLKKNLMNFKNKGKNMVVRGKSLENGLPKSVRVKDSDIREALINSFNQILEAIKELIEMSPPEVVDEIYKNGIFLTGGLANIEGVDLYFSKELKIQVIVTENPSDTTIKGLLKIASNEIVLQKLALPDI